MGRLLASTHRIQSGVVAYRIGRSGKIRVLLVGRGKGSLWGIPKGSAEPGLSLAENAAKEAFEEAGVTGEITPRAAGRFTAKKRIGNGDVIIDVWVFFLEVKRVAPTWPEKSWRRTKWVSCEKAAQMLHEPLLKELCLKLSDTPRPASAEPQSDRL